MARVDFAQTDLFAPVQPDLFAPPASEPCPPSVDALGELQALLDKVRGASVLPWIDAAEAMGEEHRVLWLAAQAGNEGARLAQAIFEETERLFSVSE